MFFLQSISDGKLFGVVLAIVAVNLVILVLWVLVDPYFVEIKKLSGEVIKLFLSLTTSEDVVFICDGPPLHQVHVSEIG